MKKIENIDSSLNKINLSYLLVFAISCYLTLELYQSRKPIVEIRNVINKTSLYNERPQEYYHEYRRKENNQLFQQIKSGIENQFKPLGTTSLNWEYYTNYDKGYVPLRYMNLEKIDSNRTMGEIVEILNSKKIIIYPDSILNCYLVENEKLKAGFYHTVTALNTDNLNSQSDTVEISLQILSSKGGKTGQSEHPSPE